MSEDIGQEYWEVLEEIWTRTRRLLDETVQNPERIWQQKQRTTNGGQPTLEEEAVQLQVSHVDLYLGS